ncbi:Inner membrane protein CreD [Alphaproteobacteria bacterium SO-S41]|nr:Inner membrane protein CreD [Alphaproteobacteria bacterium SO-S41]
MTDIASPPPQGTGGRNAGLKLFGIVLMTLVMAVPLVMISSLVDERRSYAGEAAANVAQGWGGSQTVAGPFLVVPYAVPEKRDERGALLSDAVTGEVVILARTLEVMATPAVEERTRGIFRVPVYAADLELAGVFAPPELRGMPAGAVVDWARAHLALGVGDVRGISGDVALSWNGAEGGDFSPGTGVSAAYSGIQTPVTVGSGEMPFKLTLRLRGTGRLAFVPSAESFTASVTTAWPHPSFDGAYLPETRDIRADGFSAVWRVSHLARPLPQVWFNADNVSTGPAEFGVTFYQPVDFYQLVDRSLKYAILFIGLSFLVFFLAETVTGARIHVVQYLLAGAAQVIFYLLLLAFAEQIGFSPAYLIAAAACVILTALYAGPVLGSLKRGLAVAGALIVLYGLLYTLLNEEDYALLTGAVASFLALAVTMFMTRKVDWYQAQAHVRDTLTTPVEPAR